MSETPKTDALRALMAEMYEPDNAALDHMLEKYAELERESARPEALRTVAPHVDGQDFYELCQQYRHAQEMMPHGVPNVVQAFNNLREYIKTGRLPWPSYELRTAGRKCDSCGQIRFNEQECSDTLCAFIPSPPRQKT